MAYWIYHNQDLRVKIKFVNPFISFLIKSLFLQAYMHTHLYMTTPAKLMAEE